MPPPEVSDVRCSGDANPSASCSFHVGEDGSREQCTARFERREYGWWLARDGSYYSVPPALEMTCTMEKK
jgi:hypothetical protein